MQLAMNHRQFVGRVLHVEQQPVETRARHNFDGDMARQTRPQADLLLSSP